MYRYDFEPTKRLSIKAYICYYGKYLQKIVGSENIGLSSAMFFHLNVLSNEIDLIVIFDINPYI